MKTFKIECLSTAESVITHMSGTAGNEAIISTEQVVTDRGIVRVPYLSGNALRHRAVREPGILWLVNQYGLKGLLSLDQLNFLMHGGNLTESTANENTKRIAEMQRTWPLIRLCGGTLPNQILAGSMDVWRGTLVCEENRRTFDIADRLRPAVDFMGGYQYTRGDAGKLSIAKVGLLDESVTNLMIYSGQAVLRGAMFHHGFVLKHVSDIELGALLFSLQLWQESGGTIGGQAAKGHGRLRCELINVGFDQQELVKSYVDYATSVKDDAVAWLNECFAR